MSAVRPGLAGTPSFRTLLVFFHLSAPQASGVLVDPVDTYDQLLDSPGVAAHWSLTRRPSTATRPPRMLSTASAAAIAGSRREVVCPRADFRPQSVGVLTGATNLALLPTSTEREHRQPEPKQAAGRGLRNSDGGGITD